MRLIKLSLAVATISCVGVANASDSLADALTGGKLNGKVQTTYVDQKDERNSVRDEELLGVQFELGYTTGSFYGFRLGVTGQANLLPINEKKKNNTMYDKEWRTEGFVLSEAYVGYMLNQTDIKFGRQYVNTPLVAGNYTRAFKEAFEGLTIRDKSLPNTTLIGGWYYKFQGRSAVVSGHKNGHAPKFKDKTIIGGMGPVAFKFDNIFTGAIINEPMENLKLTGAYARVTDLERLPSAKGDINLFLAEMNLKFPLDMFSLGIDANYKGSRTTDTLDNLNYEGDMLGFRAGIYDLAGFNASYAYTTVSDDDALLFGVGNGPKSYTSLPIRGPFVFTGFAGMDTHKFTLGYDFGTIGLNGLTTSFQYVKGEQDAPNVNAGATKKGERMDIEGWAAIASYNIPQVKGLSASVTYVELERENYDAANKVTKTDQNELWLQLGYKFDLLN
ncbi:OprD family outer membrane porin [Campylobacter sp. CCUG 57310]|uniref:OprD family outer membrane porin n=1 Tax=Campylobacter sp. CCUG 57310 TaxID=2517362 RepID=UPI001565E121|nr:OprD family outer membrane porin [Campylobacter sp. CCUG 57310]QKF91787.1 outer membrane porin, OprD family [Campylobacter sp. CCUG 57310]